MTSNASSFNKELQRKARVHETGSSPQTPGCRSARNLEIHHIVRRADGGTHDPSNLSIRCGSCHAAHHRGALTISGVAPDRLETRRTYDHTAPVRAPAASTPTIAPAAHGGTAPAAHAPIAPAAYGGTAPAVQAPVAPAAHGGTAHVPIAPPAHGGAGHAPDAPPAHGGTATVASSPPAHGGATKLDAAVLRAQARDALVGLGWRHGIARAAVDEASAHGGGGGTLTGLIREALRRCPRPVR